MAREISLIVRLKTWNLILAWVCGRLSGVGMQHGGAVENGDERPTLGAAGVSPWKPTSKTGFAASDLPPDAVMASGGRLY